jgi:tetratricopeptide (TPR) repeat protein
MTSPAVNAARPSAPRWRRWAAAVALGGLALAGLFGWRWFQDRSERDQALLLAESNEFAAAQPRLQRLHERHPQDVAVVRALALGHLGAGHFDEAETYLGRWCALQPEQAEPYRRRLDLWMKQLKIEQALADAGHVLRLEPHDLDTRKLLAHLLVLDCRYAQAEPEALRCLRAEPNNVRVWYFLAKSYRGLGRTALAVEWADRIVGTGLDFLPGLQLRAELHLDAGEVEPAIRLFRKASTTPGREGLAMLYPLSLALARAGRHAESQQVLAEMRWRQAQALWSEDEHRDDNVGLQERVVEALLAAGKGDEAVRFLKDVLERGRNAAGTHQLLAVCYDKLGQPERAAEHRRQASRDKVTR